MLLIPLELLQVHSLSGWPFGAPEIVRTVEKEIVLLIDGATVDELGPNKICHGLRLVHTR